MSTENSVTNQVWLDANSPAFDVVQKQLDRLEEQNGLHEYFVESGRFQTPEYIEAVHNRLAEEQQDTLVTANEAYGAAPADEAMSRWEVVESGLSQLAAAEAAVAPDDILRKEAEEIVDKMPRMSEAIGEIATKLEEQRQAEVLQSLADERSALEEASEGLARLFPAWPIPRAANYQPRDGTAEDTFPDDKIDNAHDGLEGLKKHFLDKMFVGASESLAILFAIEPGTIFTREELAEILYTHDARTPEQRLTCVSSLISNHENNKVQIIATELANQGLILQRGKRTIKDPTGKTVKGRIPIFRAIPFDAENANETLIHPINGHSAHDGGWEDKRARLLRSERSVTEISNNKDQGELLAPASATEKQFVIDLNKHRRLISEAGLLDADYLDEAAAWSSVMALHGEQYSSVRTLKRSTAWKNIIARQAENAKDGDDEIKTEYAILLSFYDAYSNYLKKPCHVNRAAEFVRQQLNSWRQTSRELGKVAIAPASKAS